jgi:hypothetical protein
MTSAVPSPADFEETYRRHVAMVVAGDLTGVMADMAPGAAPAVFDGVTVPRGDVTAAEVVVASVEGDRATGEAVYTTARGRTGLRSGWRLVDGRWKADALENFGVSTP